MMWKIPGPTVSRRTLVCSAAIVWGAAGAFLALRALVWFDASSRPIHWMVFLALVIGFLKGHFVFARLARKNIRRMAEISPHKDHVCLFAFQAMQSYLLIVGMIILGVLLRLSAIPREYLAILYLAVGLALLYAGVQYWLAVRDF